MKVFNWSFGVGMIRWFLLNRLKEVFIKSGLSLQCIYMIEKTGKIIKFARRIIRGYMLQKERILFLLMKKMKSLI